MNKAVHWVEAKDAEVTAGFEVRLATRNDLPALAVAACALLLELGGEPRPQVDLLKAAEELLEDPDAGALLVADTQGTLVGFLGASWQSALRIPGRYCVIQELWVRPDWRCQAVGAELLSKLCKLVREQGMERIEVGLPSARFTHLAATESFYEAHGFTPIGMRMRRIA